MASITAKQIIDKAAILLLDIANVRWTRTELLGYISSAQRAITLAKPDANNHFGTVSLVPGDKQALPSDGWMLLDLTRNVNADGSSGPAIRIISRKLLDAANPNWYNAAPTAYVENYIYDIQNQLVFYVYPPSMGDRLVEMNYSQLPPDLTTDTDVIALTDIWEPVLIDYVLYRACSKDAEYAPGLRLAASYYKSYATAIGMREQAELQNDPNLQLAPRDPTIAGAAD